MTQRDWRPRYVQVAEQLRQDILSGALRPGALIPSEPELAAKFDLSRTSVRNALKQLRDWGLVRAEQGRGTYVREQRVLVRRNHTERYQWEKDRVLAPKEEREKTGATEYDTGLDMADLDFAAVYVVVKASPELAERFSVPAGTQMLQRIYRTRSRTEDVPLSIAHSYLVYDVAATNPALLREDEEPWAGGTQSQLHTIGIELDRIVDELTARPPLPEEAEELGIEPGVSVLFLRKTSIDTHGDVAEYSEVVMAGDRTEIVHTTKLARW